MPNILSLPLAAVALLSAPSNNALIHLNNSTELRRDIGYTLPTPLSLPARRQVTLLSYNIRGLPWPVARGRKQAAREIGRRLGEMRRRGEAPDIVLIQEGFEDIAELVRLSGYPHWAAGPQRADRHSRDVGGPGLGARYLATGEGWGKFTGAGLHVLSDYPIMEVERAAFAACAGWDCLANKGVMMVRVDIPGLPNGLDVVNTHMNSREAAKVPFARSAQAHHRQLEALLKFIETVRAPDAPLIVGGDFNVREDAQRYYYKAAERPFVVVGEFCERAASDCTRRTPFTTAEPWLETEDLQAFSPGEAVSIRPREVGMLFDGGPSGPRLSDHDGYVVRYELSAR